MADVKINMTVKDADTDELVAACRFVFGQKSEGVEYTPAELLALVKYEMLKLLRGYVRRYRVYLREQNNVIEEPQIGE